MHGCKKDRDRPREIGQWSLRRCPNAIISEPDGYRDNVVALCNDLDMGMLSGWPDEFAGAVVAGVRYIRAERVNCQNDMMRRNERRRSAEAKQRRSGGRR